MTYSEIQITFNDDMTYGAYVQFDVTDGITNQTSTIKETWWIYRNIPYRVPLSGSIATLNERSAANFVDAFNLDYNSLGIYEVTRSGNIVTIKSKNPNITFSNASATSACRNYSITYQGSTSVLRYYNCYGVEVLLTVTQNTSITSIAPPSTTSGPTLTNTPGAYVTPDVPFTINNYTGTAFDVDEVTIAQADSEPCNNVKISVQTTAQADNITSPISQAVSTNPIIITRPRSESVITLSVSQGTASALKKICVPKLLSTYFEVEQIRNPNQTAININRKPPLYSNITTSNGVFYPLTFEYSMDDSTWQPSNSFTGLAQGSYTVYVRDSIGCKISIAVTIDEFTPNLVDYDGVCEVSNLNSIRFKEYESFEQTRKKVNNTLSFEERDKRPIQNFSQWLETTDNIRTQIKSNYGTNEATLISCNGTETPLIVTKKTNNMNKSDVRDGTIVIDENDVIGVRFGEGNTYNPSTLQQLGSYNLGSSLMSWVNEGDFISLQGKGWLKITSIAPPTDTIPYTVAYTSSYNSGFFSSGDVIQVSSVYNVVDFERYEFDVDCANLDGYYWVKINSSDDDFDDKTFVSERLWIKPLHRPHFLIDYYSTTNNEINYNTGIHHRLRLPYVIQLKWSPNNEQEVYVTDTNTVLLESAVREFYEMNIMPLPTAMAQKVVLALSLDRLFIDGQSYIMEGEPETPPLGDTNLYSVKANLVKADYVFETASEVAIIEINTEGIPLKSGADSLLLI